MRALVITTVAALLIGCAPDSRVGRPEPIFVADAMGSSDDEGFAKATGVRPFVFPDDHGAHPAYRTEWWYFTGNLEDENGAAFGFQWTVFRHALRPETPERRSDWGTRDIWFAHFAIGDQSRRRFRAFERFERGAVGLAGARVRPFAVWVGDWRAEGAADNTMFPLRLTVEQEGVEIDLVLDTEAPFVLHGDSGLSAKGPETGNASFYYSATRLAATGTLTAEGAEHLVEGSAWMDREWSTSALSARQTGWDWFSIQFDDGRDLMLFRLRQEDHSTDAFASGTLVDANGVTRPLDPDDVRYAPGRRWTSSRSGSTYPVEWNLRVESLDLDIEVRPMLDDSEMDLSVRYWEGAIRVRGRGPEGEVSGKGFLEMTGY
jgi:predicted secreted hydrolase